jgi:adenylate cyclase
MDKFTGDGLMAVFGVLVALEDHAIRACLAALDMHTGMQRLADEVQADDRIELDLVNRYRTMAKALGFEGHIAMAEAM